ncbi:unnamed protein product [Scytosiphon promiscuus]
MAKAGVTVIIPSLSGSSDLSSGVISGFRRALVRGDGGGATMEACPSIVSSLNDIPGSYDESGLGRRDLYDAGGADELSCRRGRTGGGDVTDGNIGYVNGVNGIGIGDKGQREKKDDTPTSSPLAFLPSRADGNGNGGDVQGGGVGAGGVITLDEHVADGTGGSAWITSPGATESCRTVEETHDDSRTPGTTTLSRALPPPLVRYPGNAEASVPSPPRKAPRGSYLRHRGATDFRDFFDDEEEEAARLQKPKAYAYLGGLREAGTAKYVFDRTSHSQAEKGALAAHLRGDYEPRASGYRGKNVHSVTDWRRPNTSLDKYAQSGRGAMALVAESDRTLKSQGVWVRQQIRAREQRRQRANHMLEASSAPRKATYVYRSELRQEQLREIEVLRLPPREQRLCASKTMQDQIAAADRIMRTIARYGLAGNMEDAHYIAYAADAAHRAGLTGDAEKQRKAIGRCGVGHPRKETASPERLGGGTSADGKAPNGRKTDRGVRHESGDDSADDEMSPYSLALTRPVPAAIQPKANTRGSTLTTARTSRPTQNLAVTAARRCARTITVSAISNESDNLQSERLRTFQLAGHPLRRGTADDTTAVPALIPIPEGLGNANGEHKSYAAGRIVEALRKSQVDGITGRRSKLAVPLWHRATEDLDSGAGSVLYSDLIGHTYSVLVGPKRTKETG